MMPRPFPRLSNLFPKVQCISLRDRSILTISVGNGNLLFTSRHRDLEELGDVIDILPMPQNIGVKLLLHRYRSININDHMAEATAIVDRLGGLALAIDQASAYMQSIRLPVQRLGTFLPQYLAQREKVLKHTASNFWKYMKTGESAQRESAISAFTTWEMSFQQLLDSWSEQRDSVAHFLTLSAFFGPSHIEETLFISHLYVSEPFPSWMDVFLVLNSETISGNGSLGGPKGDATARDNVVADLSQNVERLGFDNSEKDWNSEVFWQLIYQAFQLSLLQSISPDTGSESASFSLHPLIRDWLQIRLTPKERQIYTREAVKALASSISVYEPTESNAEDKSAMLTHMSAVLTSDNEYFDAEHRLCMDIATYHEAFWFAKFYVDQGRYDASARLCRRLVEVTRRVLGTENVATLTATHLLAFVLKEQGRYNEAEQLLRVVIEVRKKVQGKEDLTVLACIDLLAAVLYEQGKWAEAVEIYCMLIEPQGGTLAKENAGTLKAMNNLGVVLLRQGKYVEAEKMHRFVLESYKNTHGEEHRDTLTAMNNLALGLRSQSKYIEAEEKYRAMMVATERVHGEEHPLALTGKHNLALVLGDLGHFTEAGEMFHTVIQAKGKIMNKEHPSLLSSMAGLATALRGQGKYDEAESLLGVVIEGQEKVLGK